MFASQLTIGLGISVAAASLVAAQTSLYLPGFDPQGISIQVAGTDSEGRTTYVLSPGQATDSDEDAFIGTATLVEGPNDVSMTYAIPEATMTLAEYCTFSDGVAYCNAALNGVTTSATEAVSDLAVQGGVTVANAGATTSAGSAAPTGATASGFSTARSGASTSGPSQTSPSGSAPAATTTKSGATQLTVSTLGFAGVLGMLALLL